MRHRPEQRAPRTARSLPVLLVSLLLGGCATGGTFVPPPEEVPELEERVESRPEDVTALARLGAAYHADGRLSEAESLLRRALELEPRHPHATLFLGLVYEDQERPGEAMALYERYLDVGAPGGLEERIRGRIRLLHRQELRMAAREALAREAELAETPPEPRTVAVFPFRFTGGDEELRPLGRALADMLTTDLSVTDRLTVLERLRVQTLVQEMALGESGLVDPSTAARSGRLLGARHIVQGQLGGRRDDLRMEAAVVEVGREDREVEPFSSQDAARQLLEMEKAMAFGIYESLGISLTSAERQRVSERYTDNLQALLAYGRGLEAADAGRFQEARQHFQQAVSLDPGFARAESEAREASDLSSAESTSTGELAAAGVAAATDLAISRQVEALTRQAGTRDPAQEVLGTERIGGSTTAVELILRRPAGGGGGDR